MAAVITAARHRSSSAALGGNCRFCRYAVSPAQVLVQLCGPTRSGVRDRVADAPLRSAAANCSRGRCDPLEPGQVKSERVQGPVVDRQHGAHLGQRTRQRRGLRVHVPVGQPRAPAVDGQQREVEAGPQGPAGPASRRTGWCPRRTRRPLGPPAPGIPMPRWAGAASGGSGARPAPCARAPDPGHRRQGSSAV